MRAVLIGLLLIGIGGSGVYFWSRSHGRGDSGAAAGAGGKESMPPTTATVKTGDINFVVSVAGEIGPAEQVSVRPEVNGRISELPVDVGDHVPKDGLLFALDDRDLRIEAETREKEIDSAKLQLDKAGIAREQAKRDFERDKELYDAQLLSAQEYENSRRFYQSASKDYELAKNSIERAQKDLDLSKERLLKTRIKAPFDCTVLTRPVSVGQAVSGSGGFNSGTEVLTIADLTSMVINAHVNQADVTYLKHGMEVEVEVDAVPGLRIHGVVERIAPQATVKNNLKGYATRIALKEIDPRVQPGMTATITIPVSTANNVLTVPLPAVFTVTETGEHYVLVRRGDDYEQRPVTVGVSDFFNAEIRSGLSEGEVVALVDLGGAGNRIPGGDPAFTKGGPRPAPRMIPAATTASTAPTVTTTSDKSTTPTGTAPGAATSGGTRPAGTPATGTQTTAARTGT